MSDANYSFTTQREEWCKARGIKSDWQGVEGHLNELEVENRRLRSIAEARRKQGRKARAAFWKAEAEMARLENLLAKQRELIQKMVDAWDNNDRAAYQGIIDEMEGLWKG